MQFWHHLLSWNLKGFSGIWSAFLQEDLTTAWPQDQHLQHLHLKYHSGCYLRAWHHHDGELILLFLFFLLWCLSKYSVSSSAIVLTSRPSQWTCTIYCDSQNCYYLSWCQIDFLSVHESAMISQDWNYCWFMPWCNPSRTGLYQHVTSEKVHLNPQRSF